MPACVAVSTSGSLVTATASYYSIVGKNSPSAPLIDFTASRGSEAFGTPVDTLATFARVVHEADVRLDGDSAAPASDRPEFVSRI
jgi:hypothetical protein